MTQLLLRMPSNNSTQCHGRVQGGYLGMLLFSQSSIYNVLVHLFQTGCRPYYIIRSINSNDQMRA